LTEDEELSKSYASEPVGVKAPRTTTADSKIIPALADHLNEMLEKKAELSDNSGEDSPLVTPGKED